MPDARGQPFPDQGNPEFNRCDFAAGGKTSFVLNIDERIAVAAEKPSVTVFAMIDFRLHFRTPIGLSGLFGPARASAESQ